MKETILIASRPFTAYTVKLPNTTLLAVAAQKGYIMCGALDIDFLNEHLADRCILAARAVGVRTIDELLEAPLEKVTAEAEKIGIKPGMKGIEALLMMG
ncbi:MAG: YunC family protein [Bacillus sp. (in: firmicutes)]